MVILHVLRKAITSGFIRRPGFSLLLTAGLCLLLWILGLRFETRKGVDSVLDARGGQREVFERAREIGEIERTLFVDIECARIFSTEGLWLVREVTDAFLASERVMSAKSLTHSVLPVRRGFSFSFEPLIPPPPWSEEQLADLERFCLEHPLIRDVMVSGNGRRALVAIEYHFDALEKADPKELRAEARAILDEFENEGVRLRVLSFPFAEMEIKEAVRADLLVMAGGALLLAIIVLRVAFLGWRLAIALLLGHLLYLSILPGLIRMTGYQPEPFAMTLFPLLGAIQLALMAHIGAGFVRGRVKGDGTAEALEQTVLETGKACLFATLTTMAGFLALSVSSTDSIRELGIWGATGVAAGFVFSFGPALSILSVCGGSGSPGKANGYQARLRTVENHWRVISRGLAAIVRRRSVWLLAGAAVLIASTTPGLFLLKPDVRIESFLPTGSQAGELVRIADREYGGLHIAQIDFDSGRAGGVSGREFLEYVWAVHRKAAMIPEVTAAYSYPQILTILNQIWHGGAEGAFRLPDDGWLLRMFTTGLEAFDLPLLGAVVDPERRTAFLILRMPALSSERYLEIVETILADATLTAPDGVEVRAAGMVHEFLASDREVVRAQLLSSILVATAVGVLLLLLWRGPRLVLMGLLATFLPVAATLGIAGYLGLTLNAITVMAGAIAAGIAVDDAVHFITCWRDARRRLPDNEVAIEEAIFVKGPPIVCTSVILIGAFLLLSLSSFQPVAQLGLLVAGALTLTLPAILLILPVTLRAIGSPGSENQKTQERTDSGPEGN